MKIALISDIHGNYEALKTVVGKLEKHQPDQMVCLGDVVGYGPFPNECLDWVRDQQIQMVLGNHDAGITGSQSLDLFREPNRSLLEWTRKEISADNLEFLQNVPLTLETGNWIAAHASPVNSGAWPYLNSAVVCRKMFSEFSQDFCFVGHTHVPGVVPERLGVFRVKPGIRYIINPGSVSQSRDRDSRASYGILDLEKREYTNYRVSYNQQPNIDRLDQLGYSDKEIRRLLGKSVT